MGLMFSQRHRKTTAQTFPQFTWSKGLIMNITVIGTGNMGSAFVKQLSRAGHHVTVTARDLGKARELASAYPGVIAAAPAEAATQADIVIAATSFDGAINALQSVGSLKGKVVIDITNPLTPDYMGLTIGHTTSAAEEIAKAIPEARIVKAFNTIFAQVLGEGGDFGNGQTIPAFLASDDTAAKQQVQDLAKSIGFASIDAGGLKNARYLEAVAGLNIYLGYGAGLGTAIAPTWLHKNAA
jgi:8-hydroxy-5-deazaflavin:NADPH oxidoreductase